MVWANLQKITALIPTLYTLFEDIKYLDEPAAIIRKLFGIIEETTKTIKQEMYHKFSDEHLKDSEYSIQIPGDKFRQIRCFPMTNLSLVIFKYGYLPGGSGQSLAQAYQKRKREKRDQSLTFRTPENGINWRHSQKAL